MAHPDEQVIGAARGGDADAFSALLRRYGAQVRQHITPQIAARWRSVLDENDVMQITYLEAFLSIRELRSNDPNALLAWLTGIAENNLRDAIRGLEAEKRPDPRKRVGRGADGDSHLALYEQLCGETGTTPSQNAARDEVRTILTDAIKLLPEDYREVVQRYDLQEQSAPEVAAAMGRSPAAVYMLRARALARLRGLLPPASTILQAGRAQVPQTQGI